MDDLDRLLSELAGDAHHPGLEGIEARIVSRIAAHRRERSEVSRGAALAMIAAALGIGLISGQVATRSPAPPLLALDAGLDLAPSTRLATIE